MLIWSPRRSSAVLGRRRWWMFPHVMLSCNQFLPFAAVKCGVSQQSSVNNPANPLFALFYLHDVILPFRWSEDGIATRALMLLLFADPHQGNLHSQPPNRGQREFPPGHLLANYRQQMPVLPPRQPCPLRSQSWSAARDSRSKARYETLYWLVVRIGRQLSCPHP